MKTNPQGRKNLATGRGKGGKEKGKRAGDCSHQFSAGLKATGRYPMQRGGVKAIIEGR